MSLISVCVCVHYILGSDREGHYVGEEDELLKSLTRIVCSAANYSGAVKRLNRNQNKTKQKHTKESMLF